MEYNTEEQEYEIMRDLDDQHKIVEQNVTREYAIVKRQKEEKKELMTTLGKKEKEFDKFYQLNDEIKDWERQKADLFDHYYRCSKKIEENDQQIKQNQEITERADSIGYIRNQINELRQTFTPQYEKNKRQWEKDNRKELNTMVDLKKEN